MSGGEPPLLETVMTNEPKTIPVPDAGREYFGLSRNAAYAAAQRGDIPTIKVGKLLRVPVRALEQMLDAVPVKRAEVA
jgi:helix-turn-helix protein